MKYLLLFVLCTGVQPHAWATPVKAKHIEEELGAALGFKIYRFEVELGTDEVLVVREITENHGKVQEMESALAGTNVRVKYEIVVLDSGAFHPSLRNHHVLRVNHTEINIENKRLSRWGQSTDGTVALTFSSTEGNDPLLNLKWIGSVEKYSEVVKRWPELPKPRADGWSGSRRIVKN